MKKIFVLGSCSTCQRILTELGNKTKGYEIQDIKTEKISAKDLDEMKKLAGSYEALFSRVAMKYRSMGLNEMTLGEKDYRKYILEEYTFLKRPVVVNGDAIFGCHLLGRSDILVARTENLIYFRNRFCAKS
jgi:arsenate reductase